MDQSYFEFPELLYLPAPSTMYLSYLRLVGPAGRVWALLPK